jgi:hypothetical protein
MKGKLIIAAGVALVLALANLQATDIPNPNCKGQGGPGINKECPNPNCPMGGQGPCGMGMGKGQGGPGMGMGMGKGPGGPGMGKGQGGPGMGQGKGPANGKGKGKCLRDGTGPNCPKPNAS